MTPPTDQRIGLLAGAGDIPLYFARKAAETGMRLVSVGFTEEIGTRLEPYVEKNYCIGVGRTSKIFSTLKSENVQDLLILGKVDKSVIFRPQLFDLRSLKFLNQMRNNEDKTLMVGVIRELEKEGFRLLDQRRLMPELFPPKGVLTRRRPSKEAWQDIEFGLPLAKKVADLEIGQTVLVKNKTAVAVEALEGTDAAIERGCALAEACVAVKVSRTYQDYRYDSPGVGPQTVQGLIEGKAAVLAVEAGRVMVVDRERLVECADRGGLVVACV